MTGYDADDVGRVTYRPGPPIVRFRPNGTGGGTITYVVERRGFRPRLVTKQVNVYPPPAMAAEEAA